MNRKRQRYKKYRKVFKNRKKKIKCDKRTENQNPLTTGHGKMFLQRYLSEKTYVELLPLIQLNHMTFMVPIVLEFKSRIPLVCKMTSLKGRELGGERSGGKKT